MLLKKSKRIKTINSMLIFHVKPQPHVRTHIFSLNNKTMNICVYYHHGIEVWNAISKTKLKYSLKVQGQHCKKKL